MERLSILFSLLLIVHLGTSQGVWDGGAGTTKWNDKGNWDDDTVPSLTTNVLIDGTFTVELDMDGFCASLELRGENSFTVGGLATLKIDQNTLTGFHIKVNNKTTLTNTGFIDLENPASTSIINAGTFNNLALIKIKESGISIHNESDGLFINDGDLQIVKTKVGILNEGDFQNRDEVLLDSVDLSASGLGIQNFSNFSNSSSGQIAITRTGNHHPGIKIESNGTLTNNGLIEIVQSPYGIIVWGDLVNNDTISITDTDMSPLINNGGTITNSASGTINILKNTTVDNPGIWNWANSTIHNDGTISVDSIMGHGIRNTGCFINNGICKLKTNETCIYNTGSFNNGGTLDLDQFTRIGFENADTLRNSGIISMHGSFLETLMSNIDTGYIENSGSIIGANAIRGVINHGVLRNKNEIRIDSMLASGIANYNIIFNENHASIYLKKTDFGIYSLSTNSLFLNNGKIDIINPGAGISEEGVFNNSDTINITSARSTAIYCSGGTFNNETIGVVNINNGLDGIYGFGSFNNKGKVLIQNITKQGVSIYGNNGILHQYSTGSILLNQSTAPDLLKINSGAELNILGDLTIDTN